LMNLTILMISRYIPSCLNKTQVIFCFHHHHGNAMHTNKTILKLYSNMCGKW
jgi:hypothetical protein